MNGNLELENGRKMDDLDFYSWNERRVSLSKDFQTSMPLHVLGNVQTQGPIETTSINDVLLSYLDAGVLRTDRKEQTFTQQLNVSAPISLHNGLIVFERELCGYDVEGVKEEAIPIKGTDQVDVGGDWTFEVRLIASFNVSTLVELHFKFTVSHPHI